MTDSTFLPSATNIIDEIRTRLSSSDAEILAFWVTVSESRSRLIDEIRKEREDLPIIPFAVRDPAAFTNANVIMQDLAAVFTRARDSLLEEGMLSSVRRLGRVAFVLISRVELTIPQASSPVLLPDWFPVSAEKEVSVTICDLGWSAKTSIDSEALDIAEIRRAIFDCDVALARRIQRVAQNQKEDVFPFRDHFLNEVEEKDVIRWTEKVLEQLGKIDNSENYRPSQKNEFSVITSVWRKFVRTPPDSMVKPAKALARAIALDSAGAVGQSMAFLICRPSSRVDDPRTLQAISIIASCSAACQLSNAAAHAADYERLHIHLLRSTSIDLRDVLYGLCEYIDFG